MGQGRDVGSLQGHAAIGSAQLRRPSSSSVQMRLPLSIDPQLRPPVSGDVLMRPPPNGDAQMRPPRSVGSFMRLAESAGGQCFQASRVDDLLAGYGGHGIDPHESLQVYANSFTEDVSAPFEDMANNDMFVNGSMPANGNYYTSMMSDDTHPVDFEDLSNPCKKQQSQKVLVNPPTSSARPNHKRSKNFSEKEDEILVSAWLNVSLDPITGANQTHKSYWTRIHDYFHENLGFPSDRTQNSLMHRWSTIQDCVNKFTGCLSRIEGRRQSGSTMQDKMEDARALYKSEDGQNKSFQFEHCWKKLRGKAKWTAKLDELATAKSSSKKQKKTSNLSLATPSLTTTEGREVASIEENTVSRPMGHKKAKAALYQSGKKGCTEALENLWAKKKEFDTDKELKKDERFKQAFALEQERDANDKLNLELRKKELELRAQEVELKNKKEEERIMTMDLSGMPDEQKQYYMCCRSKIMSRHLT